MAWAVQAKAIIDKFERSKVPASCARSCVGEDATSGTCTLRHTSTSGVTRMRSIWNGGYDRQPEAVDVYMHGSTMVVIERTITRYAHNLIVAGSSIPLAIDKLGLFRDGTLVGWYSRKGLPRAQETLRFAPDQLYFDEESTEQCTAPAPGQCGSVLCDCTLAGGCKRRVIAH